MSECPFVVGQWVRHRCGGERMLVTEVSPELGFLRTLHYASGDFQSWSWPEKDWPMLRPVKMRRKTKRTANVLEVKKRGRDYIIERRIAFLSDLEAIMRKHNTYIGQNDLDDGAGYILHNLNESSISAIWNADNGAYNKDHKS